MLTQQQKVDVRRFAGFPIFGNTTGSSPPAFGYRYNEWYLILEYRMNNMSPEEENRLETVYLANLYQLEAAIPTASTNLDTDSAAVWYHNKNEVEDRFSLFKLWCQRLIEFMGLSTMSKLLSQSVLVV